MQVHVSIFSSLLREVNHKLHVNIEDLIDY